MASKKQKNVSVLKPMSFRDLVNFKKKIEIKDDQNAVLFYMEEPSNDQLIEFIQNIVFNREDNENNTFDFKSKDIVSIFKKCVKGIEIEDLTDEEVEEVLSTLPYSIKSQIENCLEILVAQPMQGYITKLNEKFEALMEKVKSEEGKEDGENQETTKES